MRRGQRTTRAVVGATVLVLALALVAGCSSKTKHDVGLAAKSAANDIRKAGDKASAELAGRALQADVKVRATQNKRSARAVNVLRAAANDVSGATVTGIKDANKDHLDDDGKVQVEVNQSFACLRITPDGKNTSVTSGKC